MGEKSRQMVYTCTMKKTSTTTIVLTAENYERLCEVARSVNCTARFGPKVGEPSPQVLLMEMASSNIECYTLDVPQ